MSGRASYQCHPVWGIALALSIIGAGAMWWYRGSVQDGIADRISKLNAAVQGIDADNKNSDAYSDEKARAARERAESFRQGLLSEQEVASLVQGFGAEWTMVKMEDRETDEYIRRTVTITRSAGAVSEWQAIFTTVSNLQNRPGVVINSMEITTSGDNRERQFQRISLKASLFIRPVNRVSAVVTRRPFES